MHFSFLVVDVFSEFFAVFLRKQSQQFLNSDDALQLNFVRLLAGYFSQRSEKFDFDLHLCSTPFRYYCNFCGGIYSILCPNYLLIVDDRGLSWVLVD